MSGPDPAAKLIWATRGRSWGFRFLLKAGLPDPLPAYERAFTDLGEEAATWRRSSGYGALRFPDPMRRKDSAGRVIPHEFVVFGELVDQIDTVEDGAQRIWPLVAEAYARVWDAENPPSDADLRLGTAGPR